MVSKINIMMLTAGHIGGIFFFGKKKETSDGKKNTDGADQSMLCKFVVDSNGKKLGESVSIDHDVLIIKSGALFLGVPLKHVEPSDKTLVVKGFFEFTKAYELGEKWRKESYHEMNTHGSPERQQ